MLQSGLFPIMVKTPSPSAEVVAADDANTNSARGSTRSADNTDDDVQIQAAIDAV